MAEEVEPIILILRSLNLSVQLSQEAAARVWDAVKRGEVSSPKEYILRLLDRALAEPDPEIQTSSSESTPAQEAASQSAPPAAPDTPAPPPQDKK